MVTHDSVVWYRDSNEMAALDPAVGTWREMPAPELAKSDVNGALHWDGSRLIALAGEGPSPLLSAVLDAPNDGEWVHLGTLAPEDPTAGVDPYPANSGVLDGQVVVWSRRGEFGLAAILAPGSRQWVSIDAPPLAPCEGHHTPLSSDAGIFVWESCAAGPPGFVLRYTTEAGWDRFAVDSELPVDQRTAVWTGDSIFTAATICCFGTTAPADAAVALYTPPS